MYAYSTIRAIEQRFEYSVLSRESNPRPQYCKSDAFNTTPSGQPRPQRGIFAFFTARYHSDEKLALMVVHMATAGAMRPRGAKFNYPGTSTSFHVEEICRNKILQFSVKRQKI